MLVLLSFFLQSNLTFASRGESERPPSSGMLGILWSCASTVVLSAWVTARPNVVPQSNALWERLKLMIGIILAPELILVWAVKHLYSAIRIKSTFKGWTLAHGYFLIMGGFSVLDQHNESRILTFEDFNRGFSVCNRYRVLTFDFHRGSYVMGRRDESDIPTFRFHRGFSVLASQGFLRSFLQATTARNIILGEINDKSKRDSVSELIAILYTLWFVVQYGARVHYGLAITELEFATLVQVFLHAIIYGVWWHKPIGVHEAEMRSQYSLESKKAAADFDGFGIMPEAVRKYWRERPWLLFPSFLLVPILIFSSILQLIIYFGLILCLVVIKADHPPSIGNHDLVARITHAILATGVAITAFIQYTLDPSDCTNYLRFIFDACIVVPAVFAHIFFPLFMFALFLLPVPLAETSGYILKTFRRIILATLHSEKGFLVLVNLPVLCIGFVLLLALSPFALAVTTVLHFSITMEFDSDFCSLIHNARSTDSESTDARSLILQVRKMVISGTHSAQKRFKSILKAPDRSQFGVTYYILFIPLILLVTFLFLVGCLFDLLFLVEEPISSIIQTVITDSFNPDAKHVPIFYAPFPKDASYPCLFATAVVGLTFFGLQCIGWDMQFSYHSKLQMSWQVTCLVISAIPAVAIAMILLLNAEKDLIRAFPRKENSITQILRLLNTIAYFLFLVYWCARMSLIPQAIVLLILRT